MALTTVEAVRGRLSLPDDLGVNTTIQTAIEASTLLLEAKLGTAFSMKSVVDRFFLSSAYPVRNGHYCLRLSQGFIRQSPAVSVQYGSSLQLIATTIDPTEVLVKEELGHIMVPESYKDLFVSVSYDAGFEAQDVVPAWLGEAALTHAISMMSAQQIGDPKPEMSEVFKYMDTVGHTLLASHRRGHSFTVGPI